jgi:hypothetical protein
MFLQWMVFALPLATIHRFSATEAMVSGVCRRPREHPNLAGSFDIDATA